MIPKTPPIKNKKLTDACRGQTCYLQVYGVCHGGATVPCHSPFGGSGMGQKVSDCLTVPGCMDCHDWLDGRTHKDVPREHKLSEFAIAYMRWVETLFREGIIK